MTAAAAVVPGALYGVTAIASVIAPGFPPSVQWISRRGDSDVTIEWSVRKSREASGNVGTVALTNLPSVESALLAPVAALPVSWGRRCFISVGWGQQGQANVAPPQVLYSGPIQRMTVAQRVGTEIVTTFHVAEDAPLGRLPAPLDIPSSLGLTWSALIGILCTEQGVILPPTSAATIDAAATARGVPVVESLSLVAPGIPTWRLIQSAMETLHLGWSISSGQLRVYDAFGLRNDLPLLVLTPVTGLLSATTADDGSVQVQALAVPTVQPGQQITVIDDRGVTLGGGPLRVDVVTFSGSTFSGESNMAIEARRLVFA